ncbi:MAG: M23 family metallopeptidase [Rhizobiaceae bacterium]
MKSPGQSPGQTTVFGKRSEPHTVIIARGDHIRHFTVRPWLMALAGSALAAIAIGYLLATTYLVLRDDLIGAAAARQARLQQDYEDRISALRAQVDRITSRQMLDQQLMETKVGELLERQSLLAARHGRLGALPDEPADAGNEPPAAVPDTTAKPDIRASLSGFRPTRADAASSGPFAFWSTRTAAAPESAADRTDRLFADINQSLRSIEHEQIARINTLTEDTYQTTEAIADALEDAGLSIDRDNGKAGVGGPFVPIDNPAQFDARMRELDEALATLERMKSEARRMPISNPAPGLGISSTFGVRKDPLLGTLALHSGMDFRAASGTAARVTAAGKVVRAGWSGGYGRMVEVEHAGGFTTRYAHLSKIVVQVGDEVDVGDVVGKTGSSGRSTGPHLHYEVRRNGSALNPLRFLKVGRKIAQYL